MIVIMPGGFHPFHAGHASLYQSALKAFPNADVYVAATNDTKTRPFPFEIKEKLAKVAGVQDGRFVQVTSPFQAKEILQNYNPEEDVVVFVRSEKDRDQQPKPGGTKKDGSPAYFQPYTGKDMQPFGKHGYMAYLPTVEFGPGIKSATEIRNLWPQLNDRRKLAMVMSLYPKAKENQRLAQNIVKMLDLGMGTEEVTEGKRVVPNPNILVALSALKNTPNGKLIKLPGGYAVVDQSDPRPEVYPNYKIIEKTAKLNAIYSKLKKERDSLMHKHYWPSRPGNPEFKMDPAISKRIGELEDGITVALKKLKKHNVIPRHTEKGTEEVAESIINERPGDVYSARQAEIIEDLGNGYFLGDDSYDDDDGFTKAGYSVYKKVGEDSFRQVGSVSMSPYSNPPGHVESEIKKIIAADQNISESADYLEEK